MHNAYFIILETSNIQKHNNKNKNVYTFKLFFINLNVFLFI